MIELINVSSIQTSLIKLRMQGLIKYHRHCVLPLRKSVGVEDY